MLKAKSLTLQIWNAQTDKKGDQMLIKVKIELENPFPTEREKKHKSGEKTRAPSTL